MSATVTETEQPPTRTGATRKRVTLTQRDARLGLWLMSPTLIVVLAIVIFPLLWSILLSFQRMRLIQIGRADFFEPLTLANYQRVLGSSTFWNSLLTTFIYTFGSVVLVIFLGVLAAMAVRQPFRGRTFVRAAYLLPYVAPVVADGDQAPAGADDPERLGDRAMQWGEELLPAHPSAAQGPGQVGGDGHCGARDPA